MKKSLSPSSKMGVILLAGGAGVRMGGATPKQFLTLGDKPLAQHSFEVFLTLPEVKEIVVVCKPQYCGLFEEAFSRFKKPSLSLSFALPGKRRQDSVSQGLEALKRDSSFVCVHDAARPFISGALVERVFHAAKEYGAAAAAMPVKFTVKKTDVQGFVQKTLNREAVWEIQTPQILAREIIEKGFEEVKKQNLTITDDVAVAELLNLPTKLVEGSYGNLKVTTPEDLVIAASMLKRA